MQTEENPNEITWQLQCGHTGTLYAYFDSEEEHLSAIEVNGSKVSDYFDGRGHPILRLGAFTDGEDIRITLKTIDPNDDLTLTEAEFAFENPFLLLTESTELKYGALNIIEHSDTRIHGSIIAERDGKLFFSIPYDKGWTIVVDGQKTEPLPAFGMFLSADLSAGEHDVELTYLPCGITEGLTVSALSFIIALAGLLAERKFVIRSVMKKP
jgi:uncharacterized membrane protein YfhO